MLVNSALLGLVLATLGAGAALADPYASEWGPAAKSRARLVADGAGGGGVEIELSPGAITYWRDPGEAGVPPTFDFSRSTNVASVEVEFPAPTRIPEDDGTVAFGYRDRVVFPLRVTAKDPGKPETLNLTANYAVCEKICLPARATLSLDLANGVTTPFAAEVAEARARVPAKVAPEALGTTATPLDATHWKLCFAKLGAADLFLEAPAEYWFQATPAPSGTCFSLQQQQAPSGAAGPILLTATLVAGEKAYETNVTLAPVQAK